MTMTDEEAELQLMARRQRSMNTIQRQIERKEKQIKKKNSEKKKGEIWQLLEPSTTEISSEQA